MHRKRYKRAPKDRSAVIPHDFGTDSTCRRCNLTELASLAVLGGEACHPRPHHWIMNGMECENCGVRQGGSMFGTECPKPTPTFLDYLERLKGG